MFRLIKWLLFLSLIVALVYGVSFYRSLDDTERSQIKKDAILALDTGNAEVFTGPLSEKIRADVKNKKTSFFEMAREKIKSVLQ